MDWTILVGIVLIVGLIIAFLFKVSAEVNRQMTSMRDDLNQRLKDTADALREADHTIGVQLGKTQDVMGDVQKGLGVLEETHRQISSQMKEFASLQDMLRPPQMRGGIGETLLENIISQVFTGHSEFYSFQHQFKNGQKVDAIIRLKKVIVPIDAKFPLESFERLVSARHDPEKKEALRDFTTSVKTKVDDIAKKYILPDEGTSDFALMYIPTEAIYYEIIKNEPIWSYALSKKVIPISPNTFYPYLLVVWKGLQGQLIRENVKEVIAYLARLKDDFGHFREDFRVLGGHLKNARDRYEESDHDLERFSQKLDSVQRLKITEEKGGEE